MPKLKRYAWSKGVWYIAYTEGRHSRRVSTGTRDKAQAERELAKFLALRDRAPETFDIDQLCDAYLSDRETEVRAPDTLRYSLRPIREHFGRLHPSYVNRALVRAYIAKRRRLGRADGTIDKELRTLRQALAWGVREGWLVTAPHVESPGQGPARQRWLTRHEAARLLDACQAPHVRLFVLVGLHTGARCQTVLDLTWDRVDFDRGFVIYPPRSARSRKRTAVVPMNDTLRDALEQAREFAETDWVIEYRGQPVRSVTKGFQAAVKRSGIAPATIHDLRRTCASWMLQGGRSFAEVAAFLADSEEVVRRHYGHFSPTWLREAADSLEG